MSEETEEIINPVTPVEKRRTTTWQIALIIAALIPLNYAIFVSLKSSFKTGDTVTTGTPENIDNLVSLTKENPSFEPFLALGVAYYNAKKYEDAIAAWQAALKYNPNSETVYSNLGAASGCLGRWQEQKMYCEKALAINPNFALARNNLAWALSEIAKTDPNAASATPAPVPTQNLPQFNNLLNAGMAAYNNKDYSGAIATWQQALKLNPNSDIVYNNMGAAYGCMSKWNEQIACCQKALAINPSLQLARNNLAWGESELKKLGK